MNQELTPEEQVKEWNWFLNMGCYGLKCQGCIHGRWCEDTELLSKEMGGNNDRDNSRQNQELSNIGLQKRKQLISKERIQRLSE